jgi:rod shape-determining protein MreC
VLDKIMNDEKIEPGEKVLTSGGDRIFPKGLLVGTVSDVSPGPESFLKITVKAAADLDRLEEVLVITKKVEQAPSVADQGPVRAVDILTDRLPSVPDKPPAASPAGASAAGASSATAPKPGARPAVSAPHDLKPAPPAGTAPKPGSPPPAAPVKTTNSPARPAGSPAQTPAKPNSRPENEPQ